MSEEKKFDRARRVTFTDFDTAKPVFNDSMDYLIVGSETCPTTGKHHWQCYVEFKQQIRWAAFKKLFPKAHIEVSAGTGEQNRVYCSKGGVFEEFGAMKKQGERNDLQSVVDAIEKGEKLKTVALNHPHQYIKYHKGIDKLHFIRSLDRCPKWRDVKVFVLVGPSGCGKTRKAMEGDDVFKKSAGSPWFDGYQGESTLVLDEIKYGETPVYSDFLQILDGHRHQVPVKGGYVPCLWTTIFITSIQPVEGWYAAKSDISELKRRITEVVTMKAPVSEVPRVILTSALTPRRPPSRRNVEDDEA